MEKNNIRKAYFDGPYGQIHVRIAGAQGVPLLLLHQSPLSGGMFDAALGRLAASGIWAVAMDTPGYGVSDAPAQPVGIAGYAQAAAACMDAMGWDRAAILGHHTGASIGAAVASKYPQRMLALVLNGVALLSDEERAFFATFKFAPLELSDDGSHLQAAWDQRLAASPGWSHLPAMHRYVVEMLANPLRSHWGFEAAFAHDLAGDLTAIKCPTLILTNTGEDLYQASQRAHKLRPDFDFAQLTGGTHDIVDEQPQAWADTVSTWLKAHV